MLNHNKEAVGIPIPNFKLYYRTVIIKLKNLILAQKETHGPMEQNRNTRSKSTNVQSNNLDKQAKAIPWSGIVSSKNNAGKTVSCMHKNEVRPVSDTLHKNQYSVIQGSKTKS